MKNRLKKGLLFLTIVGMILMSGCSLIGPSRQDVAAEALKNKYGEEFVVHSIDDHMYGNARFDALMSPANNPEVLFRATVYDDGRLSKDTYFQEYMSNKLSLVIKNDIEKLFPNSFFEMPAIGWNVDLPDNFVDMTTEDILKNKGEECYCTVLLYICEDSDLKDYEREYMYFRDTINAYIDENRMLPINVRFYIVDSEMKEEIIEYYEHHDNRITDLKDGYENMSNNVFYRGDWNEKSLEDYIQVREKLYNE